MGGPLSTPFWYELGFEREREREREIVIKGEREREII